MEVELVTEGMSDEDTFGVDNNDVQDYSNFEGERCGICMDIVIDRGVLDCCQHWFCFACIDNWATITTLCPLCQNEFQLITCVPVYDTIGSNNTDDDVHSSDDEWCIEGKNNTLSFPSYYIDENAVVCLDGDDCKIRSGSATTEEDSNLDTSIACDSCDIWYHAFCVGFDPEGTCENSWLCPRCEVGEMPQKSDGVPELKPSNKHCPENASNECLVEAYFSGKVSVSVADAGETAVVVSMVEGKQGIEEPSEEFFSSLDVCKDLKTDPLISSSCANNHKLEAPSQMSVSVADVGETAVVVSMVKANQRTEEPSGKVLSRLDVCKHLKIDAMISSSGANNHKLETPASERISIEPTLETRGLELSLSQATSFSLASNSLVLTELKKNSDDKAESKPSVVDGFGISSSKLLDELYNNEPLESGLDLHLGLSVGPSLSADKESNNLAEDQVAGDVQQKNSSKECLLPADKILLDKKENVVGITGAKRKHRDWRGAEDGGTKAKVETRVSAKKVKPDGNSQLIYSKNQADESFSDDSQKSHSLIAVSEDDKFRCISDKENVTPSIMDIVQGTGRRPPKRLAHANLAHTSSKEGENAAGLRVKKIVRRATEDKESSVLVQELRKEIRDAVRNKSSKEFGDNLFDPKLLAAFRAAVAGPITEAKKSPPLDLKAKKSLLQKGKIRESLTKKIYGIGGRRQRAWTRECEIEFWKHRCAKTTKPEKIDTLKSVLNLLRKDSVNTEINQGNEREDASSILSRLYLADTSVFPRKDDIKPISALKDAGIPERNKEYTSMEKAFGPSLGNHTVKTPQTTMFSSLSNDNGGTKSTILSIKGEAASNKVHPIICSEGPSISTLGGSKANSKKEMVDKSDDRKTDKKKWALQVLARKMAVTGKNVAQEQQEDNAVLKGTYPLLAKLPIDMRPVLGPSRHNKIPTSLRQAQLHRLTEHFLRKANLPVIRRTAEIELAVADAVNIEREVADRSNSKLVYVNLCSQELLRRSENITYSRATDTESNPNLTSAIPSERSEEATNDLSSHLEVDEALRNAGLSDSPPNSPPHQVEDIEEGDPSKNIKEEGPDNVIEMESQPELDIYGDFEYDLEDEDFIGANALNISKLQPEESKIKVVFSTLDSDRSNGAQDFEDQEKPAMGGVPKDSSGVLKCHTDPSIGSSPVDNKTEECLPQNSLVDGGGEEPSLAECEELYGPDKEPLIKKFPERASTNPYELISDNMVPGTNKDHGSMKASEPQSDHAENLVVTAIGHHSSGAEDSPNQTQKNVPRKEKKSNIDTKKQSDSCNSVCKKVEAYIKEHIRPLCKSGVITVEQYRWAVGKTTDKIMKYHSKDTNANFLVKEGEKVKKLAEQYVETAQKKGKN